MRVQKCIEVNGHQIRDFIVKFRGLSYMRGCQDDS